MQNKFEEFVKLHKESRPLLIGNVWNVQSAKAFENAGYKAIATSSAAVAHSLGYADGEEMTFDDYLFIIKKLLRSITIPLSVDIEAGYGKTTEAIVENIATLASLGVVGINLEDSVIKNGKREILEINVFAERLQSIIQQLSAKKINMFVNVRSDVFLLGLPNGQEEAPLRAKAYDQAGASGLFFPCVTEVGDIKGILKASSLPLNVLSMPNLPGIQTLQELGVKRISMGNSPNQKIYETLGLLVTDILKEGDLTLLYN